MVESGPSPKEMGLSDKDKEMMGLSDGKEPVNLNRDEKVQAMDSIDQAWNLGERNESERRALESEDMGIEDPMNQPERLRNVDAMNSIDRLNDVSERRENLQNLIEGFEREDSSGN